MNSGDSSLVGADAGVGSEAVWSRRLRDPADAGRKGAGGEVSPRAAPCCCRRHATGLGDLEGSDTLVNTLVHDALVRTLVHALYRRGRMDQSCNMLANRVPRHSSVTRLVTRSLDFERTDDYG